MWGELRSFSYDVSRLVCVMEKSSLGEGFDKNLIEFINRAVLSSCLEALLDELQSGMSLRQGCGTK